MPQMLAVTIDQQPGRNVYSRVRCFLAGRHARFLLLTLLLARPMINRGADDANPPGLTGPGILYTNYLMPEIPWSIHVVRVDRSHRELELDSIHAGGGALGLSPLSEQLALVNPALGAPVAAINGDFYQREKAYAGDPRGLQIGNGEVISAPMGGVSFWIDPLGEPHTTNVVSRFQVIWPDGATTPCGLNEDRRADGVELYTPALGTSTRTTGGRELILEPQTGSPWLPLKMGKVYLAKVREAREGGDAPLGAGIMVLSLGPVTAERHADIRMGAVLKLTTDSSPELRGVKTAIGGGPVLLRNGRKQKIRASAAESYEFSSMLEQHPRSAVGWNQRWIFLVEVDGRQKDLSIGMTLDELSSFLLKLGCEEAMNFDGGASATLWFEGKVRNSPCDKAERRIANALVVVRKTSRRRLPNGL